MQAAKKTCKVMVVGNPCNTNALIAAANAPSIPKQNFHALTRLDENRAKFQLGKKAGVFFTSVDRVAVWGNHSTTQVRADIARLMPPAGVRFLFAKLHLAALHSCTCKRRLPASCHHFLAVRREANVANRHGMQPARSIAVGELHCGCRARVCCCAHDQPLLYPMQLAHRE